MDDVEPEVLRKFWLATDHEPREMVSVGLEELVYGVFWQCVGVTDVQGS